MRAGYICLYSYLEGCLVAWFIVYLIPEAFVLSVLPFVFFRMIRDGFRASSVILFVACNAVGIVVILFYVFVWFGSGMSGGGAGTPLGDLLLQTPFQVALPLLVVPIVAVGLAVARVGTLGLWMFAMWAGFLSFWAGRGWLLTRLDDSLTITLGVIAGLCGLCAGFIASRGSELRSRIWKVLLWSGVGVISSVAGVLVSGLATSPFPLRVVAPSPRDQVVMADVLLVVALIWLSLSTLAALGTGYIKLGRGFYEQSTTP